MKSRLLVLTLFNGLICVGTVKHLHAQEIVPDTVKVIMAACLKLQADSAERSLVFVLATDSAKLTRTFFLNKYMDQGRAIFFGNRAYLTAYELHDWWTINQLNITGNHAVVRIKLYTTEDPWNSKLDKLISEAEIELYYEGEKWKVLEK